MLGASDYKEILETALDRELESFDMSGNFYTDYELDSMGAVVLFVEIVRRTGIQVPKEVAQLLQSGTDIENFLATGSVPS